MSAAVLLLLLLFTTIVHVGHVARYRTVSPIDELQHLDYLIRAPRGDIPGSGELFLQESARIQTCARIDEGFDVNVPPCVTDPSVVLDIRQFQEGGFNTAYIHPPVYYVTGGLVARAIDLVLPGDQSLLTTGRLAALGWALGAVVLLWMLFAELRAGLIARAALIVLVVSAPTILHATATVNPDGSAVAIGAAILWAVLRWERNALSAWVPVGLAALAAGTKVTNLVGVAVVVVYLGLALLSERRLTVPVVPGSRPTWWFSLAPRLRLILEMMAAVAAISVVWFAAQRFLQVLDPAEIPMVARFAVDDFPVAQLAGAWHQTVSPLQGPYLAPFLRTDAMVVTSGFVDLLVMAGAVAGAVLARRASRERRLAIAALVLAVAIGPLIVVFNAVVQGIYVVIPPRYGIALVPALVAASLPALERRSGLVVASGAAALAGAAVLAAIAFPAA